MTSYSQQSLLTLLDWSSSRVQSVLDLAIQEKKAYKNGKGSRALTGKTVALYFEKPSLRTYTTFQVGVSQLGGACTDLLPDVIRIGERETLEDIASCLGRWVDGIVIRCFEQNLIEDFAKYAKVPVINALTDDFHPCQAFALAQTLSEHFETITGKNIVFVGDGNNVANSFAIIAAKLGMNFTLVCPEGYEQPQEIQQKLNTLFTENNVQFKTTNSPQEGVAQADLIYTDVWASMGQEAETNERKKHFQPYQVNSDLLNLAPETALVSHCLPAHRGEEISAEIMDSPRCICFDEAENRLHAQKGILLHLLS